MIMRQIPGGILWDCGRIGKTDLGSSLGTALMPTYANGPEFDYHYLKTNSETIEFEKKYNIKKRKGVFRVLGFPQYFKGTKL